MTLALYSFHWDCGRMGDLEGLFVAEKDEVVKWIGYECCFGEALGKHSEIYGPLEENDIKIVSEDQEKIKWLVAVIGGTTISGYNPLNYIRINCTNCKAELLDGDDWYDYKIIDGEYYCEDYNEETGECAWVSE